MIEDTAAIFVYRAMEKVHLSYGLYLTYPTVLQLCESQTKPRALRFLKSFCPDSSLSKNTDALKEIVDIFVAALNSQAILKSFEYSVECVLNDQSYLDGVDYIGLWMDSGKEVHGADRIYCMLPREHRYMVYLEASGCMNRISSIGLCTERGLFEASKLVIGPTPVQELCLWLEATI